MFDTGPDGGVPGSDCLAVELQIKLILTLTSEMLIWWRLGGRQGQPTRADSFKWVTSQVAKARLLVVDPF